MTSKQQIYYEELHEIPQLNILDFGLINVNVFKKSLYLIQYSII